MKLKRILSLLLVVVLLATTGVATIPASAEAPTQWAEGYYETLTYNADYTYAGGKGTAAEPYEIATAEQLAQLAANCNLWTNADTVNKYGYSNGKYFVLTADIDLKNVAWPGIGTSSGATDNSKTFKGRFDGQGHVIKNLFIDVTSGSFVHGFFGATLDAPYIKNLGLVSGKVGTPAGKTMSVATNGTPVGTLIGWMRNNNTTTTLENCYSLVNIDITATAPDTFTTTTAANHYVGGLVGWHSNYNNVATQSLINCLYAGNINYKGAANLLARIGGCSGIANGKVTLLYYPVNVITNITLDTAHGSSKIGMIASSLELENQTVNIWASYAKGTIAATNAGGIWEMGVIGYTYKTYINRTGNDTDGYTWNSKGTLRSYTRTRDGVALSAAVIGRDNGAYNTTGNLGTASATKEVDVSKLSLITGVGAQTKTEAGVFSVRYVADLAAADLSGLSNVGLKVKADLNGTSMTGNLSTTTVYTSLLQEGGDDITPKHAYLIACGLTGVPSGASDTVALTFTPYLTLADGTVLYGAASSTYTYTAGAVVA